MRTFSPGGKPIVPEYQRRLAPGQAGPAQPARERVTVRRELSPGRRPSQIPPSPAVQAKLTSGPTADRHEREADRVADAVAGGNGLRADMISPRSAADAGRPAAAGDGPAGDGRTEAAIRRAAGGGKPLEGAMRDAMEVRFGADFSGVRVHQDGTAHGLSEQLQAMAFTSGRDIFLGRHATALSDAEGQRLMAHELTHVVQQGAVPARAAGLPPSRVAAPASALVQRMKEPEDKTLAKERHDQAQRTHQAQSAILRGWVEEGRKSADVRLANSCEWIASGLSTVYAVTPTGDSDDRVREKGGNPGNEVAYFPRANGDGVEGGDLYNPSGASYAYLDLRDNADVTFQTRGTTGWNASDATPNKIAVARVPASTSLLAVSYWTSRGRSDVMTTLKHEVQHVADRHQSHLKPIMSRLQAPVAEAQALARLAKALQTGQAYDPGDPNLLGPATAQAFMSVYGNLHRGQLRSPADEKLWIDAVENNSTLVKTLSAPAALLIYKTEYRAYSYQGTYDSYDNAENYNEGVQSEFLVPGQAWTDRQYHIFRQIYKGYPVVEKAWKNNVAFGGKTFREHVIAYLDPDAEGPNKLNSPRLENVYGELQNLATGLSGPAASGAIRPLLTAIGKLTSAEAAYLLNSPAASGEFRGGLSPKVPGFLYELVLGELTKRAVA